MSQFAPVAVFCFNRPEHLEKTLSSLSQNHLADLTDVYIFSDGPRTLSDTALVEKVRTIAHSKWNFKSITVHESERNQGLAKSIISGVTNISKKYGKIIVLEDDMLTSPVFLKFMNEALMKYELDERIISIHGYVYPLRHNPSSSFFLKGADCWGWATWERGWDLFNPDSEFLYQKLKEKNLLRRFNFENTYDYEGMLKNNILKLNDSWAIRWYASALLSNKLTLYPKQSLVYNFGFDNTGSHCSADESFNVKLASLLPDFPSVPTEENTQMYDEFCLFFRDRSSLFSRLKNFLKLALKSKLSSIQN
jgi:glycosyltransferase involved in cell wall biosynthesis